MQIQWYPGHMHKAGKQLKEILPQVDLVIEIVDARIPFSSENPMLAALRGEKPCIKILNKRDLADEANTKAWKTHLDAISGIQSVALGPDDLDRVQRIPALCQQLFADRTAIRQLKAVIVGIPNVGKSTLINRLAGRTIAKTGNEPAVTKNQQHIVIDDRLALYDTPGMLWPNIENPHSGYRLAATGAIKDTALDHTDIAFYLADYLIQQYSNRLIDRYELEALPQSELELLETIGRNRGCLKSGGFVDLQKVSTIFLNELRDGSLGPITLESPEMMQCELIEVEHVRAVKAEKKAARKANFNQKKHTR